MSLRFKLFTILFTLFPIMTFTTLSPALAQQQGNLVHICITPLGPDNPPYLITFRNTDIFGLVVSEKLAEVTVYSGGGGRLAVGIYKVSHDVMTGGYRREGEISTNYTESTPPGEIACNTQYPNIIKPDLLRTDPLLTSPDRAVLVHVNGEYDLGTQDFLGAFAFHFVSEGRNFQIIQLSPNPQEKMELRFPFVTNNTTARYVLIGNKDVEVRRSFENDDETFSSACPSDRRGLFMRTLSIYELTLISIIDAGRVRIYPDYGLVADYAAGGFLQMDISPERTLRQPELKEAVIVKAIGGGSFDYAALEDPNVRDTLESAEVVGVDSSGQLIVKYNGGPELIVLKPWLVEIDPINFGS